MRYLLMVAAMAYGETANYLLSEMSSDKGKSTKLEYDAGNRLVKAIYYHNKKLEYTSTISYNGNEVNVRDKMALGVEEPVSDQTNYVRNGDTITYSYGVAYITMIVNADDNIITEKIEWHRVDDVRNLEYKYQGGNRISTKEANKGLTSFKYDDKPSPFRNGKTPKWLLQSTFGGFGLNNNIVSVKDNIESIEYKYEYNPEGFPTKQIRTTNTGGKLESETTTFTYSKKAAASSAKAAITKEEWAILMQDAEFKAADQNLGAAYKQAMAKLSEADKQKLTKEQRAWVSKREHDAFAKFSKGTHDYKRFLIEKANERIAELQLTHRRPL